MKGIYRFSWNCGRNGTLDSIFVAESEDVEKAVGKLVSEKLGKGYSEVGSSPTSPSK